ncbi:flagellar biosynthesis protein FlhB [Sporanaerobacter acetigenes]|uniref:Flagellar biosynthetic protein FlhB n=1 Tax=Sporanaerobacter acetigenes DSM 13106 TaxID=1123281 RepID=A0A1M5XI70_9FIRM|nr:flagellar biosynthesis protein FlhB [Sporanaerobacter acetigenes]SHH99449.1 flagellar biosynthetic protein FlhB [Sporanaerobacter acetigenes DSM 13106]
MKYNIQLQLFADAEKTEKATPKKRKDAREEGQILQSREISSAFILLLSFLGIKIFGKYMFENLMKFMSYTFSLIENLDGLFVMDNMRVNFLSIIAIFLKVTAPVVLVAFAAGLMANYMQIGFLFTTKPLKPKLNRINPIEGFKRIFSKRALMELLKSSLKILIIGYATYGFFKKKINTILNLGNMEIEDMLVNFSKLSFEFGMRIVGVLFFLAVLDYFYQWREYEKNLMMTKQELKEEYKQTEGDPIVKSKIREIQRKMAFSRMMQDVPKADVIITNPTHIAVALKYDKDLYIAPFIVAKGVDLIAENIKKVAGENSIPIVENKPLARTIYETVEIGDMIPENLYEAVAEVLAYVYSMKDEI